MNEVPKTSGEIHIERLMQELDPGSERYRVLDVAKRFKSSWVELGEQLLLVNREKLFSHWGYSSFEEYCSREVRIKKPTAEKLTLAYRYLEKEEPALLARKGELKPLPDFRSIDLLRQAREEQNFPPEEFDALRAAVIEQDRSLPTIRKQFREVTDARKEPDQTLAENCKMALSAARRLATILREVPDLSHAHDDNLTQLTTDLENRLAALMPVTATEAR
ncbi:MAG: hypothetical protein AB7F21_04255 [Desulfuromonadales bacterium]|uniref:hypothetical protein n=1 Tax=Desulfuromonas sp. KJ2020 TaxID=2919173 RepID=UPI000323F933|nr:hypothetical protein [Desulfuromonas sp. KJ2020]MCP3177263.1 hypothetical protein [Desulfuromonas sp. KJ2020]